MKLSLSELELAVDFASGDPSFGSEVFVDSQNGELHYVGDGIEDTVPDDLHSNKKYIQIPTKQAFGMGRETVMRFVASSIPDEYELINNYFRSRGAFSKFKARLRQLGILESWHAYQEKELRDELIRWCKKYSLDYEA